jgi:hypothetical protein
MLHGHPELDKIEVNRILHKTPSVVTTWVVYPGPVVQNAGRRAWRENGGEISINICRLQGDRHQGYVCRKMVPLGVSCPNMPRSAICSREEPNRGSPAVAQWMINHVSKPNVCHASTPSQDSPTKPASQRALFCRLDATPSAAWLMAQQHTRRLIAEENLTAPADACSCATPPSETPA